MSWPASLKPGSLCCASSSDQSQTWLPWVGSTPNLSFRRISTMRWMLRRLSCSSKSGWLCTRRSKGVDDLLLWQTGAARPAHRQDEGEAELRVVVGVELLDLRKLGRGAVRQAGLVLLICGFGGQRVADHGLARKFGVGADQGQLRLRARRRPAPASWRVSGGPPKQKGVAPARPAAIHGECSYRPSSICAASWSGAAFSWARVRGMVRLKRSR